MLLVVGCEEQDGGDRQFSYLVLVYGELSGREAGEAQLQQEERLAMHHY